MQIEGDEDDEVLEQGYWLCCFGCSRGTTHNPDLIQTGHNEGCFTKSPYKETGNLIPHSKKKWNVKTMEELRRTNSATKRLPSPEECIIKSNSKKPDIKEFSGPSLDMNVSDVNNLLRRRLSLRVLVNEEDRSGEMGEAFLPQVSTFSEATPFLLSHLVTESPGETKFSSQQMRDTSIETKRRSSLKADIEKFRSSLSQSQAEHDIEVLNKSSIEQKSDKEFLDYLMTTSHFMKEALEKDWTQTKNYVLWIESHVKSPKYEEKAATSSEKWMVVLYTSSEDKQDQLTNFRCMLVRLLLQHHCIVYEERDLTLAQFQSEFQDRLKGDKLNIPQVYMQGFNVGGYRTMYAIHKLRLAKSIFRKFIIPSQEYAQWMFRTESKKSQLSLEVNLKAFPALQALAGSWSNDKLTPQHLEFVTLGKLVVKRAREQWYQQSCQPYAEPDLRRYALLRLTIVHTLIAMNKVYKHYMYKVQPGEQSSKLRRKLSWLPRFSKQQAKE